MRPIKRFEMIELQIPANSVATKFPFPDIPQLRSDVEKDIWIRGIDTYTNDTVTFDFNGNAVAPFADIQKASLTLYVQGRESIFRIPLVLLLNTFQISANPVAWTDHKNEFDNLEIDWTKSYVSTSTAFGNAGLIAFVFGISYYELPPGTMNAIKNAYNLPDRFDIPPGMPMPRLAFAGNGVTPGSMQ